MHKQQKKGFLFKNYEAPFQTPFDKLFDIFKELIVHTAAISMRRLHGFER
jgi:hypothetical protein